MMPVIRSLPLFPLDLVLYPHQRLQMYIVEKRYQEVAERCAERKEAFGIVYSRESKIAQIGSLAWIRHIVARDEKGTMNVFVHGGDRFRILNLYHNEGYLTADVETIVETEDEPASAEKERAITQHMRFLELSGQRVRPSIYQNRKNVSFILAIGAGLTDEQKQQVLEMDSESERIAFLTEHFESALPKIQAMEASRRKVQSNGHFEDGAEGEAPDGDDGEGGDADDDSRGEEKSERRRLDEDRPEGGESGDDSPGGESGDDSRGGEEPEAG